MTPSEYVHPESGRLYREGDPAHHFALLAAGLARECETFLRHYNERLKNADYLAQYHEWPSDPGSIARSMAHTIEALDKAYTAITVDRDLHLFGLGRQDEEWHRKYGRLEE